MITNMIFNNHPFWRHLTVFQSWMLEVAIAIPCRGMATVSLATGRGEFQSQTW